MPGEQRKDTKKDEKTGFIAISRIDDVMFIIAVSLFAFGYKLIAIPAVGIPVLAIALLITLIRYSFEILTQLKNGNYATSLGYTLIVLMTVLANLHMFFSIAEIALPALAAAVFRDVNMAVGGLIVFPVFYGARKWFQGPEKGADSRYGTLLKLLVLLSTLVIGGLWLNGFYGLFTPLSALSGQTLAHVTVGQGIALVMLVGLAAAVFYRAIDKTAELFKSAPHRKTPGANAVTIVILGLGIAVGLGFAAADMLGVVDLGIPTWSVMLVGLVVTMVVNWLPEHIKDAGQTDLLSSDPHGPVPSILHQGFGSDQEGRCGNEMSEAGSLTAQGRSCFDSGRERSYLGSFRYSGSSLSQ